MHIIVTCTGTIFCCMPLMFTLVSHLSSQPDWLTTLYITTSWDNIVNVLHCGGRPEHVLNNLLIYYSFCIRYQPAVPVFEQALMTSKLTDRVFTSETSSSGPYCSGVYAWVSLSWLVDDQACKPHQCTRINGAFQGLHKIYLRNKCVTNAVQWYLHTYPQLFRAHGLLTLSMWSSLRLAPIIHVVRQFGHWESIKLIFSHTVRVCIHEHTELLGTTSMINLLSFKNNTTMVTFKLFNPYKSEI